MDTKFKSFIGLLLLIFISVMILLFTDTFKMNDVKKTKEEIADIERMELSSNELSIDDLRQYQLNKDIYATQDRPLKNGMNAILVSCDQDEKPYNPKFNLYLIYPYKNMYKVKVLATDFDLNDSKKIILNKINVNNSQVKYYFGKKSKAPFDQDTTFLDSKGYVVQIDVKDLN
ncbi:hypothetical protein [Macrococcus sp. DPC7161]|uniref:hypothetical protein n=1 Tax=Macrococcus sp. DPC7161 TaxID=2507060 RepID=UPI00100B0104|nr:hypothetical protein [Macrococcus sp. DPC7161]RXK18331.1 hypothetical protein ER639_06470 [Macrococcus sp. DPC7161]